MFRINYKIKEISRKWSHESLFSATGLHGGACLFTSLKDPSTGRNITGINPVRRFNSPGDIDAFVSLNRTEVCLPVILGFIAYDYKDKVEEEGLYNNFRENIFPDFYFCLYEHYVICDNSDTEHLTLISLEFPFRHKILKEDEIFITPEIKLTDGGSKYIGSSLNKAEFESGVKKIKDYIRNGDIYQANLTRKITGATDFSAVECAVRIKNSNPIEFGVFARIEDRFIISSSPERFFMLKDGIIKALPIKGTSPRFSDPDKDSDSLKKLLCSKKDLAELAMIVDLLRNDMNRICSDVTVEAFPLIMRLRNVFHLYSVISGKLKHGSFTQIINAMFPGGSITGCPKIRSCQIIEELEKTGRGLYTGNFGYINLNGDMDFNIMIRTLFYDNGGISFNTGGGITLLSDPESEYRETVHKARNIYDALNMEVIWEEKYCLTDR